MPPPTWIARLRAALHDWWRKLWEVPDPPEHVRAWARVRCQRSMLRLIVGEAVDIKLTPEGEGGPDWVLCSDGDFTQMPCWWFRAADTNGFPVSKVLPYCEGVGAIVYTVQADGRAAYYPLNHLGYNLLRKHDEARVRSAGGDGLRQPGVGACADEVPAGGAGQRPHAGTDGDAEPARVAEGRAA